VITYLSPPRNSGELNHKGFESVSKMSAYIISLKIRLGFDNISFLVNPFVNFNIAQTKLDFSVETDFFKYDYDSTHIDLNNKIIDYEFNIIVSAFDNDWVESKINFMINNMNDAGIVFTPSPVNTLISWYKLPIKNYLNLEDIREIDPNLKTYPNSFLNHTVNHKKIYISSDLYSYFHETIVANIKLDLGEYVDLSIDFPFIKNCSHNCLYCKNNTSCIQCEDGYFLSGEQCFKCSSLCLSCVENDLICTVCSNGVIPISN
jgi:hypothetical protein